MITRSGRLLVDGRLRPGRVQVEDGRIVRVELDEAGAPGAVGAGGPIVAPGLIDLHVHGFGGHGPLDSLEGMARELARQGTTAFQPTLFPAAPERLGEVARGVWASAASLGAGAARVLGLHLEGPFVNPRSAGALPVEDLAEPSVAGLRAILGPATGDRRGIRTITLAPELPGALELVEELHRSGVRASLGHSLATAEEARRAARGESCGATHLFNAMGPWHHRRAGLSAFALTDDAVYAELIGDLCHVGPEAVTLAVRARGPRGTCLVSDALRGAGTGCDRFHWHGREHVIRDGAAWYPAEDPESDDPARSAPRLAGSATGQLEAVRRLVSRGVLSVEEALTMGGEAPARALGLEAELGRLVVGARADLLVLEGPGLELREVLLGGDPAA